MLFQCCTGFTADPNHFRTFYACFTVILRNDAGGFYGMDDKIISYLQLVDGMNREAVNAEGNVKQYGDQIINISNL